MTLTYKMPQRSEAWYKIRKGIITASSAGRVIPPGMRKTFMYKLLAEIMRGEVEHLAISEPMQRGMDYEDEARDAYIAKQGSEVEEVGFCISEDLPGVGCSPDGLVGPEGLVEIKCPNTSTHIQYLMEGPKRDYVMQMQFQMLVTDRKWCDFVTWDDRVKNKDGILGITRIYRDDEKIQIMKNCIGAMQKQMIPFLAKYEIDYPLALPFLPDSPEDCADKSGLQKEMESLKDE